MDNKELVRFYFDTMALNDQLMQWYRAFFLAFETIIVAAVFALHGTEPIPQRWTFSLAIVGLVLSFLAVWACVQRGNIVDRQKRKIQKELFDEEGNKKVPDDELADCFEIYSPKRKAEKWVPRWTFNVGLHVLIAGLLLTALWSWMPITPNWYVYLGITFGYAIGFALAYGWLSHLGVPPD